jgi:hypothetical protein
VYNIEHLYGNGINVRLKNDFSIRNNIIWFNDGLDGAETAAGNAITIDACTCSAPANE